MSALKPKVVAAVDLGTHGTGIGWCVVSDLNDDPVTRLVDRTGTVLAVGHRAQQKWAKAADAGNAEGLGYAYAFKTALKEGGALPGLADRRRVRRLIAAYLGEVRTTALAEISVAGYTEPEIRWCITVPAIWDEDDKAVMRAAAADAGFPDDDDRLLLSIEPEAAALYCYLRMADLDGTRFMVIDCGGGTVDITAYESLSGATACMALNEIGVATGGRLGSEYINQAFRASVLTKRFSVEAMERIEREKTTAGVELDADGTPHVVDPVTVDIPPTVWAMLDDATKATLIDEMAGRPFLPELSPEEVETLFGTVTAGILEKVEEQLASMRRTAGAAPGPETLVIVGGFAQSAWLQAALRHRFGQHRILIPQNPALAVLEGRSTTPTTTASPSRSHGRPGWTRQRASSATATAT